MATYNWAYKPNVPNKYGIVIADSAEDVKPSNACYIALFGSDTTGNGSRLKPYRTPNSYATYNIYSSGTYRGAYFGGGMQIGDGDVIFENILTGQSGDISLRFKNIKFTSQIMLNSYPNSCEDCTLKIFGKGQVYVENYIKNTILDTRYATDGIFLTGSISPLVNVSKNNTFLRSKISFGDLYTYGSYFSIFSDCNIYIENTAVDYSLFHNCRFSIGGGVLTEYASITDLAVAIRAIYPSIIGWEHCYIGDPKFNNPEIGDYSLAFDSPAKNLSYFGTYIGAQSIGYPFKARTTETAGDFDFSTAVNVTVVDNSITMTDDSLVSVIETVCKPNLIQRAFSKVNVQGFNADRNGQYIDSIKDLANTTTSAGTNLVANTPYIVEVASITYNGAVILAGERFTTSAVLSFTSAGGGVCREITEAPQRHTIEARFNDGGATKSVGDALTVGYWYYVGGTITYNGVDYTNRTFKAVDTNSFTGSGIVMEALTTQAYQHYEIGIPFTSNNVGDARTGAIVRGNGDPAYERGATKEFPINARFAQIKFTIQPNNLKP